jgi:predicted hotdog family 3-hydroxylacyl-ACP dehydratase
MPHRGPALLLTGILRSEPRWVEVEARVPADHPFVCGGAVPSFLGLELGAQAAAALQALNRRPGALEPAGGAGFLVRVRDAEFLAPTFPAETALRITARLEGAVPPLAVHRITVSLGEVELVRALLSTYRGSE